MLSLLDQSYKTGLNKLKSGANLKITISSQLQNEIIENLSKKLNLKKTFFVLYYSFKPNSLYIPHLENLFTANIDSNLRLFHLLACSRHIIESQKITKSRLSRVFLQGLSDYLHQDDISLTLEVLKTINHLHQAQKSIFLESITSLKVPLLNLNSTKREVFYYKKKILKEIKHVS